MTSSGCNAHYLDAADFPNKYGYLFSLPPGLHGEDVPNTFYNNGGFNLANFNLNVSVSIALQDYIGSFVTDGYPSLPSGNSVKGGLPGVTGGNITASGNIQGVPKFVMYGEDAQVVDLDLSSITEIRDPVANERCDWWQKAFYL